MSSLNIDETTRAQLRQLRLLTFSDVYFELEADEEITNVLPEKIFLKTVAQAAEQRRQRNIAKAITHAKFRYPDATLAELINPQDRGIDLRQLKRLATTNWRGNPTNVLVLAPTGTGKTYIACALGIAACQAGYSVACYRLINFWMLGRSSCQQINVMQTLCDGCKIDLLILDDFPTIGTNQRRP